NQTPFGLVKSQIRLGAHDIRPSPAVSRARMNGVHAVLDAVQPVAVLGSLDGDVNIAFADEKVVARDERRRLRAKISKNQSAELFHWIGRQADGVFVKLTIPRLSGNLQ